MTMIPIVSFIGWQDSGKTTFARQVISILRDRGLRVGAIKSSHHQDIAPDPPASDTALLREAGAEVTALLAPDQMVIVAPHPEIRLPDIVNRFFAECDIVIGEGFKNERHIPKIEMATDGGNLLRDQVTGVIAVVSATPLAGDNVFRPDQAAEVAEFIVAKYLAPTEGEFETLLYVDGRRVPLKGFVQEALAGTVSGFVRTLKQIEGMRTIELRVKIHGRQE